MDVGVAGGAGCMSNQVLYHLGERGIEWKLLPDCQKAKITVMAYSPLGQAEILEDEMLGEIAAKHSVSSAAIALAWVLRQPGVVAIPKAGNVVHVEENAQALTITLDDEDLAALDVAFPPPTGQQPLAML